MQILGERLGISKLYQLLRGFRSRNFGSENCNAILAEIPAKSFINLISTEGRLTNL